MPKKTCDDDDLNTTGFKEEKFLTKFHGKNTDATTDRNS
jgi:hypothetical protein